MAALEFPILEKGDVCYMDNAATSLMPRQVIDAVHDYETGYRSNVARGIYPWAERATERYEEARSTVAHALGAKAVEVVFTSGTSAALDMAAQLCLQLTAEDSAVLVTEAEHHSNIVPWQARFAGRGGVRWARCGGDGQLDLGSVQEALEKGGVGVVAITHASNVTGVAPDVRAVATMAKEHGALVVVDGAQHLPHSFVDPRRDLDVDFYAFSGHKCNGPTGIGVLWARSELLGEIEPMTGGGGTVVKVGGQTSELVAPPHCLEVGTPNIAGVIGLGTALDLRTGEGADMWYRERKRVMGLRDALVDALSGMDKVTLVGPQSADVPIVSFNVDGCHPHDVCQVLGDEGVYVRGGHHCAQPMMRALGVASCVRASLGPHNKEDDDRLLCDAIQVAAKELG